MLSLARKTLTSTRFIKALNTETTLCAYIVNKPASWSGMSMAAQRSSLHVCNLSSSSGVNENEIKEEKSQFKIPQHYPSKFDRFTLIMTRTLKADEIGTEISHNLMEKANTKRRIMVNVFLMVFTFFGSIYWIRKGKRDVLTDNIYEMNKRRK